MNRVARDRKDREKYLIIVSTNFIHIYCTAIMLVLLLLAFTFHDFFSAPKAQILLMLEGYLNLCQT